MMKHFVLLILFSLGSLAGFAQPYQVGHKQKTFADPSRSNRNITTEIYYPSDAAGNNVPIAPGQFPVLVFRQPRLHFHRRILILARTLLSWLVQ
jgi:hypothetical protein